MNVNYQAAWPGFVRVLGMRIRLHPGILFLRECQRFSIAAGTMSPPGQLLKHLELARRDLLELSTVNRMLSTPREQQQGAAIEIVDESSAEVFRMLVREGSTIRFEEGVMDESFNRLRKNSILTRMMLRQVSKQKNQSLHRNVLQRGRLPRFRLPMSQDLKLHLQMMRLEKRLALARPLGLAPARRLAKSCLYRRQMMFSAQCWHRKNWTTGWFRGWTSHRL